MRQAGSSTCWRYVLWLWAHLLALRALVHLLALRALVHLLALRARITTTTPPSTPRQQVRDQRDQHLLARRARITTTTSPSTPRQQVRDQRDQHLLARRARIALRARIVLLRQQVLRVYRQKLADFGLTFACEKLAGRDGPAPKSRYPATLADGRGSVAQATPTRAAPQPPAGLDGAASANWCRWTPPSMTGWRAVATAWC